MTSDPNRKPTIEDLNAADEYANSKLCLQIPKKFMSGLTYWDNTKKQCRITKAGCNAGDPSNPISIKSFSSNGTMLEWEKMVVSKSIQDFWKIVPPQNLIYKTIKGSGEEVCARANFKLEQFCRWPAQRGTENEGAFGGITGKGYDTGPNFKYIVRNGKETCIIGKDYCDFKGVSYDADKEECYVSDAQKVGEALFSTYLMRAAGGGG
jgi:hypothetical protein